MSPGLREDRQNPVFVETTLPFWSTGHVEMLQICARWHFVPWCSCSGSRAQEAAECMLRRKWEGGEQNGEGSSLLLWAFAAGTVPFLPKAGTDRKQMWSAPPAPLPVLGGEEVPGWVRIRAPTMSSSTKDAVWDPLKTSGSAAVPTPPGSTGADTRAGQGWRNETR